MIKLTRKIKLDKTGLRINLELDFIKYYQWLVHKYHYDCIKTCLPKHGGHISIITKKLHKEFDYENLKKYHNEVVHFSYDPYIRIGGSYFTNYWLFVSFPRGDEIKREMGIREKGFLGFHATIASDKSFINNARTN